MRSKKYLLLAAIFIGTSVTCLKAQSYIEQKSRFRFAQTYVGVDSLFMPPAGKIYDQAGNLLDLSPSFSPRVTIGGLHFWGYADFYVSFPVYRNLFTRSLSRGSMWVRSGIETGFHGYPWQLKYQTVRPFLGLSWTTFTMQQRFENGQRGLDKTDHRFPLIGGLSYHDRWGQIDLTCRYVLNPNFDYHVTPQSQKTYNPFPWSLGVGYKFIFDTTRPIEKKLEKVTKREDKLIKEGKISSFNLGIGPSSAITLSRFEANTPERSFLNFNPDITISLEATTGYHMHPMDAELRFAYRLIEQSHHLFGVQQAFLRHALSLEFIKFVWDYHGFVPFLGVGVECNYLSYQETSAKSIEASDWVFGVPVVFGWDIRTVISTKWLLRTTLRYNPLLSLSAAGNRVPFDHFEFNFIQFVYYWGR